MFTKKIPETNIYFGERPGFEEQDIVAHCNLLKRQKFTTLISFADRAHHPLDDTIRPLCKGITLYHFETTDHINPKDGIPEHNLSIKKIQTVVRQLLTLNKNPKQKIYMYCGSGKGRSQVYALAFMMQKYAYNLDDAKRCLWGRDPTHLYEITNPKYNLSRLLTDFGVSVTHAAPSDAAVRQSRAHRKQRSKCKKEKPPKGTAASKPTDVPESSSETDDTGAKFTLPPAAAGGGCGFFSCLAEGSDDD